MGESTSIRTTRWLGIAAGLVLFALATRTEADPDLWGHLRVGLDTLHARAVTLVDPYSFTQDRPWINHPWFGEVLMAIAYRAGGIAGLALLKGTLVFGAMFLVWSALKGTELGARMLVTGMTVLGSGSVTVTLRPQLWSLLLLAVVCRVLSDDDRRLRRWLPALFALWANLHGGWIVGLGILSMWAAVDVWSNRPRFREWAAIVTASAAATLINPYGIELWRFMRDTVQVSRNITEWQPLVTQPVMNWLPVLVVCLVSVWLVWRPFQHRLQVVATLIFLGQGAWRVSRLGPLFVVSAAVLLAPRIIRKWPEQQPHSGTELDSLRALPALVLLAVAAIATSGLIASSSLRCFPVSGTWVAPVDARRLLATAPPGRLVTYFDWGEYSMWHLGPRLRVSIDARRETVYTDARLAEHDAIVAGDPAGLRALDGWRAEYVWLPASSTVTKTWLASHGYRVDLDAPDSFVAVRADLPELHMPASEPVTSRRCFPK